MIVVGQEQESESHTLAIVTMQMGRMCVVGVS